MSKRLHGGSSPVKEAKYKAHFDKIKEFTSKGKINKKKKISKKK